MAKKKKEWRFTFGRKASLRKAQKTHAYLVDLGKRARARGMR
jgi:hypothetical protein